MMKKEHRIEVVKYLTRLTSININSKNDKFSLLLLLFLLLFVDRHISSLNTHTWRLTSGYSLSLFPFSLLHFLFSTKEKKEEEDKFTSIVVLWIPLSLFLSQYMQWQWWWWWSWQRNNMHIHTSICVKEISNYLLSIQKEEEEEEEEEINRVSFFFFNSFNILLWQNSSISMSDTYISFCLLRHQINRRRHAVNAI